ncbi:SsgA family sporulation/cell division regulator [Streptomyces sp. NPDC047079]|uniref:SsgA family sporulation/cell division regulator n=1 Tax=Streptomyces sp. NPDC047079 TaxID=3154607 RepID=UPI0033C3F624
MRQVPSGAAEERSITFKLEVQVTVAAERPISLPAELRYDRTDPYAVRLCLGTPSHLSVDWVFARSLLVDGLRLPTGTGDVLVSPRHRCHPGAVRIILRSRTGSAALEIAQTAVTAFLRQTEAELGDEGTNDLLVSQVIRTGELQAWFLAEQLVDTPLVRA